MYLPALFFFYQPPQILFKAPLLVFKHLEEQVNISLLQKQFMQQCLYVATSDLFIYFFVPFLLKKKEANPPQVVLQVSASDTFILLQVYLNLLPLWKYDVMKDFEGQAVIKLKPLKIRHFSNCRLKNQFD